MNARDLLNAWDEGVERALGNTSRADELGDEQLNSAAGVSLGSGVKGGGWGADTERKNTNCSCAAMVNGPGCSWG